MIWTPIFIFVFRTLDVLTETVRLLLTVDKRKSLVSVIAFFEVLVWVYVFNELVATHHSWWCYFAYAAGYSLGTWLGITWGSKIQKYVAAHSEGKEK